MDRRTLIVTGLAGLSAATLARAAEGLQPTAAPTTAVPPPTALPPPGPSPAYPAVPPAEAAKAAQAAQTYSSDEIVNSVSDFLGVTAESAGGLVEKVFAQKGRPTAYIAGVEGAGALGVGLRYGRGLLYMKDKPPMEVFWQGPSVGWDVGGNASRVFTLCYNLQVPEAIYQRFPGAEGSAYLVGGLGVNYQQANGITLAPIRAGVGARLGVNAGYLAYTRKRNILPF